MANTILACSSIVSTLLHMWWFSAIPGWTTLQTAHTLGCLTSILNHTLTHKSLQRLDRSVIAACVVVDLWYCTRLAQGIVVGLAVVSFLYSKWRHEVVGHVLAHALVTLNHGVWYVADLKKKKIKFI